MDGSQKRNILGWGGTLVGLAIIWSIIGSTVWKNEISPIMKERYAYNEALSGVNAGGQGLQKEVDCVICEKNPSVLYDPQTMALRPEISSRARDFGCTLDDDSFLSYHYSSSSFDVQGVPYTYSCVRFSPSQ